jgi:zinc protease
MIRSLFRLAVLLPALTVTVPLTPAVGRGADPAAASQADAPRKVVSVEGISEYQLDNGLRVLLYPDASAARVTVNMTVLVGSRHEGYGEGGMAHLLEHMLFKGTPPTPTWSRRSRTTGPPSGGVPTAPPRSTAPTTSRRCPPAT